MKILFGSENISKKLALEKALRKLEIYDFAIITYDAKSNVSTKPIDYEIIRGAENRNKDLKKYAYENNIRYDYLCSIEDGFSLDENGFPFIVTYCIIEDELGKRSIGKSLGIRLTKRVFNFIKKGGSLNKIIELIAKDDNNKQGVMGYLSNGLYDEEAVNEEAVVSSFISFIYREQRETLDEYILKLNKKL